MNALNGKAFDTAGSSHFIASPRGSLRWVALPILLLALAGLLSSCPAPSGGEVSGSVSLGLSLTPSLVPARDLIAGQFIVKFKPRTQSSNLAVLNVNGLRLTRVRTLGTGATLYRADGVSSAAQSSKLAARLEARSDVEYAQADRRLHAQSDPLLPDQWNLQARAALSNPGGSSAVNAWTRLEGKVVQPVTVAVLDTGILWRTGDTANSHPDLEGHVLPGFDFVSDPASAGDGDGRDADGFDPGDEGGGRGSWHGSHVAGIITAVHNDLGVAGVADNARVQAVRVLGIGGGSLSDVLDGLLWAAGLPVAGAPSNPTPAGIINLSLGGSGLCGAAERDAISKVNAQPQSPVIVVAAGNDGVNVGGFTPSGCDGVLAIGASDRDGARPSYSNYGASLALLAPGGSRNNAGGYDNASAILSTIKTSSGALGYGLDAGTSMSAPMVSGAIALMRGVTPSLSRAEVSRILEKTAVPVSAATCRRGDALECGAGLLDVDAAVKAAILGLPPEPPVQDYSLGVPTEATLIERGSSASVTLIIARVGGFDAPVSFAVDAAPSGLSVTFTPNPALDSVIVKLEASADSELGAFALRFHSSAAGRRKDHRLNVNLVKSLPPSLIGARVGLFKLEGGAVSLVSVQRITETPSVFSAAFSFVNLEPGVYVLIGWRDANGNGQLEIGESVGAYVAPEGSVRLEPPVLGADFDVETLDVALGARLEMLGLPVGLETALVSAVAAP